MKLQSFTRSLIAATLFATSTAAFATDYAQLPFSETFNSKTADGTAFRPDSEWSFSTTCPGNYPPKWKYDAHVFIGSQKVLPPAGEGGLAYISTYDYTPESDFSLTSEPIDIDGMAELEFGYSFYVPSQTCGNASVEALVSFDGGLSFSSLHKAVFDQTPEKGWNRKELQVDVPWGGYDAILRVTARNSAQAIPIAVDEIRLRGLETPKSIYPASVSDFSASLRDDRSAIDLELKAPTRTHASLGDVLDQPLEEITKIILLRQIGYATDYVQIHEFTNPTPGGQLTFADTDLSTCGEYYYKALVYLGQCCDYGNYVDNPITIGQIPGDVTSLKATTNRGTAPVTLSFALPSADIQGNALTSIEGIRISRYNNETFVWDNIGNLSGELAPGEETTFEDPDVVVGEIYEYRVVVLGSAGNSYGSGCSVYVGADMPVRPTDLVAAIGDDGLVHLTWTAPEEGMNNGWIDTENLTYVVQRGNNYSDFDADFLQGGITECSYTDPTGFAEEEAVRYFVKAVSQGYDGFSAISDPIIVGDPSELPFVENFNKPVNDNVQAQHSTWLMTSTEPASDWAFAEMAYFIMEGQAMPVDNDGGLAYVYYGPYSTLHRTDWLTSGNINISQASPQISFWHYGVPGYDTTLDLDISIDGGDFYTLRHIDYSSDITASGWQQITIPVDAPAGAETLRMRFAAGKGDYSCSVAIDNVRVTDRNESTVETIARTDATVTSQKGRIDICCSEGQLVRVAAMSGEGIYNGHGSCTLDVAPGLYLVAIGMEVFKLLVK